MDAILTLQSLSNKVGCLDAHLGSVTSRLDSVKQRGRSDTMSVAV